MNQDGEDRAGLPAEPARLRIGHEERTAAMKALDEHLEAGRLDVTEYSDRSAAAGSAVYRDELDALFGDLPEPHLPAAGTVVPARPLSPDRRTGRVLALIPVLLGVGLVVLVVTGNAAGFMMFPLLFLLMGSIGHHRRPF